MFCDIYIIVWMLTEMKTWTAQGVAEPTPYEVEIEWADPVSDTFNGNEGPVASVFHITLSQLQVRLSSQSG